MNHVLGSGIITPMLTPLNEDESVNYKHLTALVDHLIEGGIKSILSMGSSGEFARFDHHIRGEILKRTVESVAGRASVFAGVSDAGLLAVLRNVESAEKSGADAIVLTLPYYFPIYNDDEAYSFFSSVASSTKLPVFLYDIPKTCGASISLDTIDKLFNIKNIVGIKDSSGNFEKLRELLSRYKNKGKDFAVVLGDESLCFDGLLAGIDGIVPSLSNPYPKLFVDIYETSKSGDESKLRGLCNVVKQMNEINAYCNAWMSPNVWRKKALSHMGICNDYCTKPYVPIDPKTDLQIQETIKLYKIMYKG